MTEYAGVVHIKPSDIPGMNDVSIHVDETGDFVKYQVPYGVRLAVEDGDHLEKGQSITEGSKAPASIMKILGLDAVYEYIIKEIQRVYRSQSVNVNDKHIEIIARQMTRKIRVDEIGDTNLLLGSLVDINDFEAENDLVHARIAAGEEGLHYAVGAPVLLGITKASLATESFLSAASFQETTKVLTEAAIRGKVDHLIGLKENVIIGKLIPAGTGMSCYHGVDVKPLHPISEEEEFLTEDHDGNHESWNDASADSWEHEEADEEEILYEEGNPLEDEESEYGDE